MDILKNGEAFGNHCVLLVSSGCRLVANREDSINLGTKFKVPTISLASSHGEGTARLCAQEPDVPVSMKAISIWLQS